MKLSLVVLALCLGVAVASTSVCLPNQYQWAREQQFQPLNNNGYGGFDISEEWFDFTNKNFRKKAIIWENGQQIEMDTLLIGSQQTLYIVNATKGSGQVTCTVKKAGFPPTTPCLFNNATIQGGVFIAGDVYSNIWAESKQFSANNTLYEEITLTAEDNVPISSRHYLTEDGASFELYFNFDINLDPNAFQVPSICPPQGDGYLDAEELKQQFNFKTFPKW